VVDFRRYKAGRRIMLKNRALIPGDPQSVSNVLRFDIVKGGKERARVPNRLRWPYLLPSVAKQETIELGIGPAPGGGTEWKLNGQGFDHERIDVRSRLGTTEIWRFVNRTPVLHPMHTHLAHFKVLSVGGRRPHPADQWPKDTVPVPGNQTAVVRVYFTHFPGRYVFHCHALEHGDRNMMAQMEVSG
jgi:spore coat protein A, manganese oxidase